MIVLGIHAFTHDAAATLCRDGRLIAFAEEERFSRIKGDPAFPLQAIAFCLKEAGVRPDQVDRAAVPFRPAVGAFRRLAYFARRPHKVFFKTADLFRKGRGFRSVPRRLKDLGISCMVTAQDHYACHARAVFSASPFEEAAVLVVDGVAEGWSGALYHALRHPLPAFRCLGKFPFPHSLGLLYAAVTEHLGFHHNREEGKIMAMASLGDDRFTETMRRLVHPRLHGFRVDQSIFDWAGLWTRESFQRRFAPPRTPGTAFLPEHFALARAVQSVTEETCLGLALDLLEATGARDLCFTGGLALNPALNRVLAERSGCRGFYAFPAGGDAGTAMGAALVIESNPDWRLEHAFWGSHADPALLRAELHRLGLKPRREGQAAVERAAELLSHGAVGGWFAGRAEMGPRALGHRSILADPRRPEIKDRINDRIKKRESFQPFAPAVAMPEGRDLFEDLASSPFMLRTFKATSRAMERIPAVIHADGRARIQTVDAGDASGLRPVLEAFHSRTGVPVLLNTSLNLKGEPLAGTPADAVRIFIRGGLDFLYLDGLLLEKEGPE
jgi:carbamoyltransferase